MNKEVKNEELQYQAPALEVIEVEVEKGFANSVSPTDLPGMPGSPF